MPLQCDYCRTSGGILKIIALVFNVLAIIFVQSSEYPYYAVKGIIVFDALPIAAIVFSASTLLLLLWKQQLQSSTIWLRNEWLILFALIIVYVYTMIYMIGATIQCHQDASRNRGCPNQLLATISGICAIVTYCCDIIYRTLQWQNRNRKTDGYCESVAAVTDDEANVEDDDEVA